MNSNGIPKSNKNEKRKNLSKLHNLEWNVTRFLANCNAWLIDLRFYGITQNQLPIYVPHVYISMDKLFRYVEIP